MLARDNPFTTDRVEQILQFKPEWAGLSWQQLDATWKSLNQRATISGHHGSGKTCLLDAWATRLEQTKDTQILRIFLNREQKTITPNQWEALSQSHGKTIILDGEEQLNIRARSRFYKLTRSASGIIVTRHSKGKLPTLLHLDPDHELLVRCVKEVAPEQYNQLSPMLPKWWKKHRGNLRSILLECYDSAT